MTKISVSVLVGTVLLAGVAAKLRALIEKQAPLGYQDENGFHLGLAPAIKKSWPPFW